MLTEIYIETLLVDEELADRVWEAWDAENLTDGAACIDSMVAYRWFSLSPQPLKSFTTIANK